MQATREVGGAVLTAVATTIVSFLPVFTMEAAEGKLFRPLAFTKTFALLASLVVALCIIPALAYSFFGAGKGRRKYGWVFHEGLIYLGGVVAIAVDWRPGLLLALIGGYNLAARRLPERLNRWRQHVNSGLVAVGVTVLLVGLWTPLGPEKGTFRNLVFVAVMIGGILGGFRLFQHYYHRILRWCLAHKAAFLSLPLVILILGAMVWQGSDRLFGWLPRLVTESSPMRYAAAKFPGLGKEFMPPLDEGSYLYMPVTMPHASIGEVLDILQRQDRAISAIPEVKDAVGKLGRADSPLDPAPISMIETVINYHPEYLLDARGTPLTFRYETDAVDLFRDPEGRPLPAADGKPYHVQGRFVRDDRRSPDPRTRRPAVPALAASPGPGAEHGPIAVDGSQEAGRHLDRYRPGGHDSRHHGGAQAPADLRPDRHAAERHPRQHGG